MKNSNQWKTRWRRLRAFLEWTLVVCADACIPHLPRRFIVWLSEGLGRGAFRLSRRYRTVALQNLDLVYGDSLPPDRKRDIARTACTSFARLLLDLFWFRKDSEPRIRRWVVVDPSLADSLKAGRQLCITAHYGNWEVLGQTVASLGHSLASVATPLANQRVNERFNQSRRITGQEVIPRQGAIRAMLKVLRADKKVAVLLDQNVKPSQGGTLVDFFGLPVPVSEAGAALALRTGSPILFGFCIPLPDGRYKAFSPATLSLEEYPDGATPEAVQDLTQRITKTVENQIRRDPEYWHWFYKRWKHRPPGTEASSYPAYSKPMADREVARLDR